MTLPENPPSAAASPHAGGGWRSSWAAYRESRAGMIGLALIGLFLAMALAHPVLIATVWPERVYDPEVGYDLEVLHPALPSLRHPLGTDVLGRDLASQLLAAATPTFVVGLVAGVTTAVLGTLVASVAAFYRGRLDRILTHLADTMLLLPAPLLMIILGTRFSQQIGPTLFGMLFGLVTGLGAAGIVLRARALQVLAAPFVDAARVAGGGGVHILRRHVLPHLVPLAGVYMMLAVTGAVVADGFVAFMGLERTRLNWGNMVFQAFTFRNALTAEGTWHILLPPAMAISLFAAAFYLVSVGLRNVVDPRVRADR